MKYGYLVIGVFLVAIMGYGVYALYPRFALAQQGVSLPLLAVVAGMASFFSPCSFSLLTALLARESGIKEEGITPLSIQRVKIFALALAAGASLFFVLAGIGVAVGASAIFASVTFTSGAARFIRLLTSVVLILLGLMQLGTLSNWFTGVSKLISPLMRYQARHRRQAPTFSFFVLGFAYPAAGFGWTGPILVGLAGYAFATGGNASVLLAIMLMSMIFVLLVFGLAFTIAKAQEKIVQVARVHTRTVKRWGGFILLAIGVWTALLTLFADFFATLFPV